MAGAKNLESALGGGGGGPSRHPASGAHLTTGAAGRNMTGHGLGGGLHYGGGVLHSSGSGSGLGGAPSPHVVIITSSSFVCAGAWEA